jgi:hypothetical protein
MLGASWVDGHSIAALAAEHNQLLNALLLAANRSRVGLLCGLLQLRPFAVAAASTAAKDATWVGIPQVGNASRAAEA